MTEGKQVSRTEYITPKTEKEIIAKAMAKPETSTDIQGNIKSETTLKQEAITKLTNLTLLFQKKIESKKTRDNERQKWARLEIEAIRTLGTLLTQKVEQDIHSEHTETHHILHLHLWKPDPLVSTT
jgi:hypothetical protein